LIPEKEEGKDRGEGKEKVGLGGDFEQSQQFLLPKFKGKERRGGILTAMLGEV